MMLARATILVFLGLVFITVPARGQEASVEVQALLGKTAVLLINGQRKTMRVGETHDGVTLVATKPTGVTLDINGESRELGLSQRVNTQYQEAEEQVVTITRDARMQYQTNAMINGRSAVVLVDTGAEVVALSSARARSMNIDYSAGVPTTAQTASGLSDAYRIKLRSVSVGGIEVNNVTAMVVRGNFPVTILLGMSYLRHVKMEEHNGVLSLSRTQ